MAAPTCPADYTCTFTRIHPRTIVSHDLWWHGPWGIICALTAILAITVVVLTLAWYIKEEIHEKRTAERRLQAEREQRQHDLDMAEQRTMQLEQAKGDPEMLKMIQGWR